MKKLTLFLFATLFSALSFAALNPYAYGLSSSLDGTTLKVNYSLNAPATGVSVVIMDGAEEVKTVTCDGKISKGSHSVEISTLDLPTGKSLTWKVNVTGAAVTKATAVSTYRFYHPSSVDIDNNPESPHFGRLLCIEASHSIKTADRDNTFLAKGFGAGIFAFNAAFEPIKNGELSGFNGGNTFTTTHYAVRRVRISDDGRIFVTAQNDGGCFLWEVDPDNLNNWTKVFNGTASTYTTTTADSKFMAGTNSGFDVHGSGENLKLVMLSASKSGGNISTFRCDEYDLGTKTEWSTIPSRSLNKGYHYVTNQSNVQYDAEGGIWHIQYRGKVEDTHPGLVHINKDGVEDFKEYWTNARNAGFCFNKDYSKVIIAGKFDDSHVGTQKYATIYTVSKNSEGKPTLTKELEIDMTNIGAALNDFAWDWADNIYAVDNNGEYLCAYALPHKADKVVSTPCASRDAFELEEVVANVYTLTTNVVGEGTVEGNAGSYVEGKIATLTATPAAHYDFVNWTGDVTSTDNPLTITVNSDMTVTANFQEHTKYTITAQAADNTMGYVTGGGTYYAGETVTLKAVANSTYCFVNWSDGNTDATRTFTATADVTLTANFAKASSRAWAYDLKMVEDGDNYKFSFNATTAANATLLFLDKEGNELYAAHEVGAVAAGANTVSIEKAYFTQVKDVYWAVKMDGEAISHVAEITDQTRGIYDFYNMQGVVVDNDPNSERFGEIYIEMAKSGTTNSKAQTLGLFLLNQNLDVLNTDPNVGIQPTMPSGYALNGTNYTFQRLNIHPKTGDLVFSYGISTQPAVFAIDRENMTAEVTNLLNGVSGLTKTVAHCFDAEGTLYVMDIASSKGTIYKIKDGIKTVFAATTGRFISSNITMAADGRGGLWVAQYRGQIDYYYQLVHFNDAGKADYSVYDDQGTYKAAEGDNPGVLGTSSTGLTGSSIRGALAYDIERQILAQGRNNRVELFNVTYDPSTGVPTVTKFASTPVLQYANIDGLAFDYAGDLYVVNSGTEKFYKYTLPTAENICTVPAPESQAIIKEVRYNVTVNTVGNGTTTGAGEYVVGSTATLEATPAAHHKFVNWTYGSETSTDNPLEIVVNGDITVTANFEEILYTLIAPTNDENKGTVTGAGAYSYGTEVTLEATPKEGYKLLYWSDRSTENPRTITMNKNEALSAYFVKEYAEEPTFKIEKMWENTQVPGSADGYQAVGWDGNIYMQNKTAGKIKVYTNDTDAAVDYATSNTSGQQIAVDEAGNLIVFNATFYTKTPNAIMIYPKGSTTGTAISFTLPHPERCDFISASGDIYSAEGGYVYFYCQNKNAVNRVKITNGELASVDAIGNTANPATSVSHVMVDIFGNLAAHCRSTAVYAINSYTGETTSFTTTLSGVKLSTLGGCTFELGGKEFWAYNVGTNNYNSEWNLYNMTDKVFMSNETLYAKDKDSKKNTGPANWLNVQVVDENTAYIYQFCPEVAVAMWKVSINRTDLQEFTVTASANDPTMGTVTGGDTYYEEATATLIATPNAGYRFVNWTKAGVEVSTNVTYTFTVTEDVELVANFAPLPEITYELNGGVWNKYGWTSKKDMYNALLDDWRAYSGSTRTNVAYETQLGIGNSSKGIPTTVTSAEDRVALWNLFTDATYAPKWGWLATYVDAVAATQYKKMVAANGVKTQPTSAAGVFTFTIGNFFGEDNAHTTDYIDAVDFTGAEAYPEAFQPTWGQSLPNPTQPTTTVVLGNPIRENYLFGGWYAESDFSGVVVTTVDENTDGTLYAKWVEHFYTRAVSDGEYGTICLPYASSNYSGAEFYEVSWLRAEGANAGLYLDEVVAGTILEAGKPYIFRATGNLLTVYYEGDKVDAPVEGVNGLTGTFVEIRDLSSSDPSNILEGNYLIAENKIWLCETSCVLYPNRAYIKASGLPKTEQALIPGRRRVCMGSSGENTETGTENALTPNVEVIKRIENGQVIIIRDGVKYNVQGQKMQ